MICIFMESGGDEIKSKQASKKDRTLYIIFDAEIFEIRQFPQNIWNLSFIKSYGARIQFM